VIDIRNFWARAEIGWDVVLQRHGNIDKPASHFPLLKLVAARGLSRVLTNDFVLQHADLFDFTLDIARSSGGCWPGAAGKAGEN
jgi:hypothetical protein